MEITKEAMEQYEKVRASGICNMFDMNCVATVSKKLKFKELYKIVQSRKEYGNLLENFSVLMKKYGIKQR
ncbi:MAG: DUF5049 domain-containing protein [Thermodesulfobacteriota bacterium]